VPIYNRFIDYISRSLVFTVGLADKIASNIKQARLLHPYSPCIALSVVYRMVIILLERSDQGG
jgi:hypothetical protein